MSSILSLLRGEGQLVSLFLSPFQEVQPYETFHEVKANPRRVKTNVRASPCNACAVLLQLGKTRTCVRLACGRVEVEVGEDGGPMSDGGGAMK